MYVNDRAGVWNLPWRTFRFRTQDADCQPKAQKQVFHNVEIRLPRLTPQPSDAAAQGVLIRRGRGPPVFAPVVWLGCNVVIFFNHLLLQIPPPIACSFDSTPDGSMANNRNNET